jgi:transcription termination factor NusB
MKNNNSRTKSRKYLFQKLFSLLYNYNEKSDFDYSFLSDSYKDKLDEAYIEEMEKIILEKEAELIYILQKFAPKFSVEKMDRTYIIPVFI